MLDENIKYMMLQYLDEEEKIIGLPIDEFIPVACILVLSFFCKILLTGVIISFCFVKIMRRLKQNKGKGFLYILAYWHGNELVGKVIFPSFPKSTDRYFI